jgi:hypothetical protein
LLEIGVGCVDLELRPCANLYRASRFGAEWGVWAMLACHDHAIGWNNLNPLLQMQVGTRLFKFRLDGIAIAIWKFVIVEIELGLPFFAVPPARTASMASSLK